uniref:Uncharacterized protein n=1 Tax=Timema douglasi TaxID=61478 RepID=A0A7R8Z7K1_TIMDO|nr:unnamed protein product [Timema douglasi]
MGRYLKIQVLYSLAKFAWLRERQLHNYFATLMAERTLIGVISATSLLSLAELAAVGRMKLIPRCEGSRLGIVEISFVLASSFGRRAVGPILLPLLELRLAGTEDPDATPTELTAFSLKLVLIPVVTLGLRTFVVRAFIADVYPDKRPLPLDALPTLERLEDFDSGGGTFFTVLTEVELLSELRELRRLVLEFDLSTLRHSSVSLLPLRPGVLTELDRSKALLLGWSILLLSMIDSVFGVTLLLLVGFNNDSCTDMFVAVGGGESCGGLVLLLVSPLPLLSARINRPGRLLTVSPDFLAESRSLLVPAIVNELTLAKFCSSSPALVMCLTASSVTMSLPSPLPPRYLSLSCHLRSRDSVSSTLSGAEVTDFLIPVPVTPPPSSLLARPRLHGQTPCLNCPHSSCSDACDEQTRIDQTAHLPTPPLPLSTSWSSYRPQSSPRLLWSCDQL